MKLSTRLQTIYDLCTPGEPLWDIGCDHGLLGRRGLLDKKFSTYYFVEPSRFAMQSLKKSLKAIPNEVEFLELRGQDLNWSKVTGNVVMAGMGARTMVEILEISRLAPAKRNFILSPQWSVPRLLEFFDKNSLTPTSKVVREGTRDRIIFQIK